MNSGGQDALISEDTGVQSVNNQVSCASVSQLNHAPASNDTSAHLFPHQYKSNVSLATWSHFHTQALMPPKYMFILRAYYITLHVYKTFLF